MVALTSDLCVAPMMPPEGCRCLSPSANQEPSHSIGMCQDHSPTQSDLTLREHKSERERQTIYVDRHTDQIISERDKQTG